MVQLLAALCLAGTVTVPGVVGVAAASDDLLLLSSSGNKLLVG